MLSIGGSARIASTDMKDKSRKVSHMSLKLARAMPAENAQSPRVNTRCQGALIPRFQAYIRLLLLSHSLSLQIHEYSH